MTDTAVHTNGKVDEKAAALLSRIQRVDALRSDGWKVTFDDGEWVQLRDPATLSEAERSKFKDVGISLEYLKQMAAEAMQAGNVDMVEALADRLAAKTTKGDRSITSLFIASWSFNVPVPTFSDPDHCLQIPPRVYDRLSSIGQDLIQAAFVDTSVSTDSAAPFDASAA